MQSKMIEQALGHRVCEITHPFYDHREMTHYFKLSQKEHIMFFGKIANQSESFKTFFKNARFTREYHDTFVIWKTSFTATTFQSFTKELARTLKKYISSTKSPNDCPVCWEKMAVFNACPVCSNAFCTDCASKISKCPLCRSLLGPA